jgi:hypothetical protein
MTMADDDRRLDGNTAGGPLGEVFALETTALTVTCAGCGQRGALGAAPLYASGPGSVLRCPGCDGVLVRYARIRGELVIDLSGIGLLSSRV